MTPPTRRASYCRCSATSPVSSCRGSPPARRHWLENYNGYETNSTYKYLVSQNKGNGSPVFQYSLTASDSWWSLIG
jgi:hypothetical protein